MASKQKESGKRKRVNRSNSEKLELIKKLEWGASVVRVCDEYGLKKETVSGSFRSMDRLTSYAMKFDVAPSKDRKGDVHKRKHTKVPKRRELEEAVYKWYVQQRSVSVNVRGLEIADAANKLACHMGIESFKASEGWLWRLRNRHGIGNQVEHVEPVVLILVLLNLSD